MSAQMTTRCDDAPDYGSLDGTRVGHAEGTGYPMALGWVMIVTIMGMSAILGLWLFAGDPGDDAYITFRFARNLAEGDGLTWNPQEPGKRVEGYSNFLWTVMLAGLYRLGVPFKTSSQFLGLAATELTVLLLWVCRRIYLPVGCDLRLQWVAPLLYATSPVALMYAFYGLETTLFGMLVFGAIMALTLCVASPHSNTAPVLLGLVLTALALTRAEGVAYSGLLLLIGVVGLYLNGAQRSALVALLSFAVPYGAYFAWRYTYYGLPLPLTVYAKAGTYGFWRKGLEYLWRFPTEHSPWMLLVLPLWVAWLGRRREWVFKISVVVVLLLCGLVTVKVGHDYMPYGRYFMPVLAVLYASIAAAVGLLLSEQPRPRLAGIIGALAAVVFAVSYVSVLTGDWQYRRRPFTVPPCLYSVSSPEPQRFVEFSQWLGHAVPRGQLVAVRDCGLLPYYSDLNVIDIFGLCNERVAMMKYRIRREHGPWTDHAVFPDAVLSYEPAYIILTQDDWLDWTQPEVAENYELMAAVGVSTSDAGMPTHFIYRRHSAPALDVPERFLVTPTESAR